MKSKIIELAQSQIGNNYEKYCRDMGYNYRIEWCACFISWLAQQLEITSIIPVDMSCNKQIAKFKELNCWHTDNSLQTGDIIYYDWDNSGDADHVGIVEINQDGLLTVIEGNNGNYPDDRVRRRSINATSNLIFGYARPNYTNYTSSAPGSEVDINLPVIQKDNTGKTVKTLQILLSYYGYSVGSCGIDGEFGSDTENAVKQFQKNSEIDVDGIVGEITWSKLLS